MKPTFYITTPIYYVNGAPHIGHAYTSIASDVLARFKRLDGYDVFFLTGTDEHGQKVEKAAAAAGLDPQRFADQVAADFRDMAEKMGISYDDFIRTTEERHKLSCAELWRRIAAADQIYLGHYEGWYAVRDEAFYDEGELVTRPDGSKVGAERRAGRVGAGAFAISSASRLGRTGCCSSTTSNPDFIAPAGPPQRGGQLRAVGGLRDLSISRTSFRWGIPVPGDPAHVMYVWLDALTNYVTACGFPDPAAPRWHFWPADLHVVGKDILRFHAVYWPAFLMAAGLPLPKRVYLQRLVDGRGREDEQVARQRHRPARAGRDLRARSGALFPAAREAVRRRRRRSATRRWSTRINVELANDLGNLAQRTLSLIARNCERKAARRAGADRRGRGVARRGGGAARAAARAAGPAGVPRGAGETSGK